MVMMSKGSFEDSDVAELQTHSGWMLVKQSLLEDIATWDEELRETDPFKNPSKVHRLQVLMEAAELFIDKPKDIRENLGGEE